MKPNRKKLLKSLAKQVPLLLLLYAPWTYIFVKPHVSKINSSITKFRIKESTKILSVTVRKHLQLQCHQKFKDPMKLKP